MSYPVKEYVGWVIIFVCLFFRYLLAKINTVVSYFHISSQDDVLNCQFIIPTSENPWCSPNPYFFFKQMGENEAQRERKRKSDFPSIWVQRLISHLQ